jgi:GrpB-like predicted nucleotidyltransferase (UPF0157 family)
VTLRAQKVEVKPYDAAWPEKFAKLGGAIREALGDVAVRIDHKGSTSVPGLAAKPVIDIQVSVRSLEPEDAYRVPLQSLGYQMQPDNDDLGKRFFFRPTDHAANVHVREAGTYGEQVTLLFRDYLRTHPEAGAPKGAGESERSTRKWTHVDQ